MLHVWQSLHASSPISYVLLVFVQAYSRVLLKLQESKVSIATPGQVEGCLTFEFTNPIALESCLFVCLAAQAPDGLMTVPWQPPLVHVSLAAAISGLALSVVLGPVELVKVCLFCCAICLTNWTCLLLVLCLATVPDAGGRKCPLDNRRLSPGDF